MMKIPFLCALSAVFAVGIVGCGNTPSSDDSASPSAAASGATTATSPSNVMGPPTASETADANTKVPETTTIDGKSVPLKKTASGLRYYDMKVGTGAMPKADQTVTVNYTGTLLDGTKFDSSYDHGKPFDFTLGQHMVIPGWDEGVATMKIGGKRRLIVPGDLAYGPNPPPGAPFPPNATLAFDIELLGAK